jgi:hypothetical protein
LVGAAPYRQLGAVIPDRGGAAGIVERRRGDVVGILADLDFAGDFDLDA